MGVTNNVALEILRHGQPHNQLLSPLTEYLALCGNHPSTTVRVPYEHAQFLARHKALTYDHERRATNTPTMRAAARRSRELQLQITAQEMSTIFAAVPGLIAELKLCRENAFTHFELVTSAAELALLPFELANAPNGCPGVGQPLTLQSEAPLCLTRRVRRIDNENLNWPDRPRILFAFNLPPRDSEALVPAHLLALRKAIDPWVGRHKKDTENSDVPPRWVGKYLTVLERASTRAIVDELSEGNYTHLHLLAHGVETREGVDRRFALVLRNSSDPFRDDEVTASRLATMVRALVSEDGGRLALPSVVTLASCNGANGGSVVGAGSSIAHALHEAGIPLVISSQFPLSFRGSVMMVETLYEGLLWGEDPRLLLCDLRRKLKSELSDTHDWASLVCYAALPSDIGAQLKQLTHVQIFRCIEAAFSYSDLVHNDPESDPVGRSKLDARLSEAKSRLESRLRQLQAGTDGAESEQIAQIYGLLASATKREAELDFRRDRAGTSVSKADEPVWKETLRQAQEYYRLAFRVGRSGSWSLIQDISITAVLECGKLQDSDEWKLARILSDRDRRHEERQVRAYAISNLMELRLISLWFPFEKEPTRNLLEERYTEVREELLALAKELKEVAENDWEMVSRRRQLHRYMYWFYAGSKPFENFTQFQSFKEDVPRLIKGLCKMLLDDLPADPDPLHH